VINLNELGATMETIEITQCTLEQLKALAYDQVVLLNQAQVNLNVLQSEIAKREAERKDG
jgi:hypothetical protein